MIVVYADESGTHDPSGKLPGSQFPIIAGFAARKSSWDNLSVVWPAVLKKYNAPYFHGRELRAAQMAIIHNKPQTSDLRKNPYYSAAWTLDKIESFRHALTKIAVSGNKIPVAGGINLGVFEKIKDTLPPNQDPYKYCMSHFFQVYHEETWLQWGNFKSDVSFFFDQNPKKEWRDAVFEVFETYQKVDARMRGPYFDDKDRLIPLQAADLLAYRMRQLLEDAVNGRCVLEDLDHVLLGNLWKSAMIKYPDLKSQMKRVRF